MNYKIINAKLLLYKNDEFVVEDGDLYVKEGEIASIGCEPAKCSCCGHEIEVEYEVIDAKNKLVMPGLINMHTHAYMTVLRNYADDVDFGEWLFNRIDPAEATITPEDAYNANLFAFADMIMSGTTSYVDMHMFKGMSSKASNAAGMRAFIGRGLVGEDLYTDGMRRFQEALDEKEEYENSLTTFSLAPHAIYTCSPKFYEQVADECAKRGMQKQTHLSESKFEVQTCLEKWGKTPTEVIRDTGFMDENTILAHCVQMTEKDIEIIKEYGSTVVSNAASNAKLGNGFAPMTAMKNAGINITLGTDGTASNNSLNMFREIAVFNLIHKGICEDPTAMPAQFMLKAVTINAAKALGMEGKLGIIKEGARADLLFIDLHEPSMYPNNNIISSLCYSATGAEVKDVMIDGRFVMKNRMLLTIDTEKLIAETESWERYKN